MIENPPGSGAMPEEKGPPDVEAEPKAAAEPEVVPMPPPPSYAPALPPQAWGTAAPARRGAMRGVAIGLVAVFLVAVVGGAGAFAANAYLSDQYSAQRAAMTYFSAQQRGDVDGMLANANFVRGDGSYEQFFDRVGVNAMMGLDQNKQISDVKILSTRSVDARTDVLNVSMTWAGSQHIYDYTVRKDTTRTSYLLYSPWRVDIPDASINVVLPNQAGAIQIDGMPVPSSTATSVEIISGFHNVEMTQTPLYEAASQVVSAVELSPNVTFDGKLSTAALAAAKKAVLAGAVVCDANQYDDCPNHLYRAPNRAGYVYYLTLPGYAEIDYTTYVFRYSGDITSGMLWEVPKDQGLLYATGTCAVSLTINGGRTYRFKGTWGANLTWANGAFSAEVFPNCEKSKA